MSKKINEQLLITWRHISGKRKLQLALLFILTIIASFFEMATIGAVIPFIGILLQPESVFNSEFFQTIVATLNINSPKELVLPLTIAFILLAISAAVIRIYLLWVRNFVAYGTGADISRKIFTLTLNQDYSELISQNSSELISGISNKANIVTFNTILPVIIIFSNLVMTFLISLILFLINPIITLVSLSIFGCFYLVLFFIVNRSLVGSSEVVSLNSSKIIRILQESMGGIRDVILHDSQHIYMKLFSRTEVSLRNAQAEIQFIAQYPRFILEGLAIVLVSTVAYLMTGTEEDSVSAIPLLAAFAVGAQRLLPVIQTLYAAVANLKGGLATLIDVNELLDRSNVNIQDNQNLSSLPFVDEIKLKNISFNYKNRDLVLKNIELNIPKGSRIGIVGKTGSGKSTLIDVVMGLLTPTEGALQIDDLEVSGENSRAWRAHIAHIPQQIFLLDESIAKNIAFCVDDESIDLPKVKEVAAYAQLADVIDSLPEKYLTNVGEDGVKLSGGQRQRLGIARALYRKADVIILDEATSALDTETEKLVLRSIDSLQSDLTILMVAHRIESLSGCDKIVEVVNGEIAKVGNFDDYTKTHLQDLINN